MEDGYENRRQPRLSVLRKPPQSRQGLASTSIRRYRDGIRLFLLFLARENRTPISKLRLSDLSADNVRAFLAHLEAERSNSIRARNHRLAMLHTFFAYAGGQEPIVLPEAERIAAIGSVRSRGAFGGGLRPSPFVRDVGPDAARS